MTDRPNPTLPGETLRAVQELSLILMDQVSDPAVARRVAECFEFLDQPGDMPMSVGWWRRAADMGDRDARDYLRDLIDQGKAERLPDDD